MKHLVIQYILVRSQNIGTVNLLVLLREIWEGWDQSWQLPLFLHILFTPAPCNLNILKRSGSEFLQKGSGQHQL